MRRMPNKAVPLTSGSWGDISRAHQALFYNIPSLQFPYFINVIIRIIYSYFNVPNVRVHIEPINNI